MNGLNLQANLNNVNTTILGVLAKEVKKSISSFYYLEFDNLDSDVLDIETLKAKLSVDSYLVYSSLQNKIISKVINLVESGIRKIILDEVMVFVDYNIKKAIINYLEQNNVTYINITNDIEDVLFSEYLVVIYDGKVALEGNTMNVLKEEKLLKRMGYSLPFIVDLSLQLNYYGLIKQIHKNKDELVNELWN